MEYFNKISISLASFNGENFIKKQLQSILLQLNKNDEVIIVDDCSTDRTIDEILSLFDDRIKIYKNEKNLGIVASFNKAISLATGNIIFLSDQDDLWSNNKVGEVVRLFREDHDLTLVISDAALIDENDSLIHDSYFELRGGFKAGLISNLIKNKYLGCCIAINSKILPKVLPIPKNAPMHDIWIGNINNLYGKIFFINKPLVFYRRHGRNVTALTHSSVFQMMKMRIFLIYCLLVLFIKNK